MIFSKPTSGGVPRWRVLPGIPTDCKVTSRLLSETHKAIHGLISAHLSVLSESATGPGNAGPPELLRSRMCLVPVRPCFPASVWTALHLNALHPSLPSSVSSRGSSTRGSRSPLQAHELVSTYGGLCTRDASSLRAVTGDAGQQRQHQNAGSSETLPRFICKRQYEIDTGIKSFG